MTESKSPSSNRIPRPSILPPAALGHTYPGNQFQPPLRHKISQALQSSGGSASSSPAVSASAGVTQFHVSVPLGPAKDQLTVVTSYPPKLNSSGPPTIKAFSTLDKIPITLSSSNEMRIKHNVKNVEIQNVSYVKQVVGTSVKSLVTSSPNVVQATIKRDVDNGKVRPVFVSQGLRQPLKPHQIPKTNVFIDPHRIIPRSTSSHAPLWVGSPSEAMKTNTGPVPLIRNKSPFQNATVAISNPHDLNKKNAQQQPKSTISIPAAAHIPLRDASHRTSALTVAPLSSGNKSIYQVLTTELPPQGNSIKKISARIVCQPSSVSNSVNASTGFASSNNALPSGHVTIMTSSNSVTYASNSNGPSGTNISTIPVAKVYPQQQVSAASRVSVTSTTPSRFSVPVMSSIGPTISRSNPPVIQLGHLKPPHSTSIIMSSQPTVMSTIPVAVSSKSPANSGSILCLSSYNQTYALPTVTTSPSSRPNLTHSSGHSPSLPISGTIRVQPPNVLLVEPKTAHLQASVGGSGQTGMQDNRANSIPHSPSQAGISAATTPTQSPKPTILRRQRPENNSALKKLTFGNTSIPTQRRELNTKMIDRRHMPYPLSRTKIGSNAIDGKLDMPVIIHSDKSEIKPVLENQVFIKQHIAGVSAPLKLAGNPSTKGLASPSSNSAKDGGTHAYSIHPVLDSKLKIETLSNQKVVVKSEPASASQMLQLQNQSMHTYAAEGPPVSSVQHRMISQESGQHITTNTIFTKPVAMYSGQHPARTKPSHVIKAAPLTQPQDVQPKHGGHPVNSFPTHRLPNFSSDSRILQHDLLKKEAATLKTGLEVKQQLSEATAGHVLNQVLSNHILASSSAKPWASSNTCESLIGLSPRKRPRKQTHVVSDDQPVVMEDEELTDDADECEDEPMVRLAISQQNSSTSTASSCKLNDTKVVSSTSNKPSKAEPPNKKPHLDETRSKVRTIKAEPVHISSDSKPQSEFTDRNGVRYVVSRKRPAISVLNKAKQNSRSISNHFMHYSDVKVKDKKTTIAELAAEKKRLKGLNVARFALQLQDMVSCEKDIWERMKTVFDGIVEYKATNVVDSSFDSFLGTLSPATPSLSNSFRKATPRTARTSSGSGIVENGIAQSPSTPLDRKGNKLKEDILNIEELAQANLQRCRVVCDQLTDTKSMMLKAIDHRQLVTDILDSTNNQKSTSHLSTNQNSSKRLKKKTNS